MHDSESKYFRRIKHIKDKEWESNNHMIPNAKPFAFVLKLLQICKICPPLVWPFNLLSALYVGGERGLENSIFRPGGRMVQTIKNILTKKINVSTMSD